MQGPGQQGDDLAGKARRSPRIFPARPRSGYPFLPMASPLDRLPSRHPHYLHPPSAWEKLLRLAGLTLAVTVLLLARPHEACAQVGTDVAQSGIRGTIGGMFVGAEATMLIEGALKVRPVWAYALGGGL